MTSQPAGASSVGVPKRPTISVVMPNHNDAVFVGRAIESVLAQTRLPDEFLILDDASTDNSVSIIDSYAARYPWIRFVRSETNLGVNRAHRKLFELAKCDYVHALAADDARFPNFIQQAFTLADLFPQAGILCGKTVMLNESDVEIGELSYRSWTTTRYGNPQEFCDEVLRVEAPSNSITSSTVFRRDAFAEVGYYCDELESWGDTFSAIAIGRKYGVAYTPERWAIWRKLTGSYSQRLAHDPRKSIDLIYRAAAKMRSPEFRDRFPESFVRSWQCRYVWRVVKEYWRGDTIGIPAPGAPFLVRYRHRLPRTWSALALVLYRPRK